MVVIDEEALNKDINRKLLNLLDTLKLSIKIAPSMDKAFDYEVQLKSVKPEDLLQRASVQVDYDILRNDIENKVILVTGAGGSIGSEISRQLLGYAPKKLILLDTSEYALYLLSKS